MALLEVHTKRNVFPLLGYCGNFTPFSANTPFLTFLYQIQWTIRKNEQQSNHLGGFELYDL